MCSHCKTILVDFQIKHEEAVCPLRKSLYCSTCAIYGHTTKLCPVKPDSAFTEPLYVEQLILPSERRTFRIRTKTLLPGKREPSPVTELHNPHLIEIKDTDAIIREYLKNHGVVVVSKKDLRPKMNEFAKKNGKVVRYIPVAPIGKSTGK